MSKSRGNVVNPDDIVRDYGADTSACTRCTGPAGAQKPWNTRDIVGMSGSSTPSGATWSATRRSGKVARRSTTRRSPTPCDRQLHRTIKKVGEDIEAPALQHRHRRADQAEQRDDRAADAIPRELAETFVLLLAPFAPHIAEEIWQRLGHDQEPGPPPVADVRRGEAGRVDDGAAGAGQRQAPRQDHRPRRRRRSRRSSSAAEAAERVRPWVDGKTVRKRLYVPKKLVNLVVG